MGPYIATGIVSPRLTQTTRIESNNPKFRKIVGMDIRREAMEQDLDRTILYVYSTIYKKCLMVTLRAERKSKNGERPNLYTLNATSYSSKKKQVSQMRSITLLRVKPISKVRMRLVSYFIVLFQDIALDAQLAEALSGDFRTIIDGLSDAQAQLALVKKFVYMKSPMFNPELT